MLKDQAASYNARKDVRDNYANPCLCAHLITDS